MPYTPLEECRCFSLSLHSWITGNIPQTTLTQLFGECMNLLCPGLCSFEVKEIALSNGRVVCIVLCSNKLYLTTERLQAGPQSDVLVCTKCSVKTHRESKCTQILYLTIFFFLCVAELWIIPLSFFLSWREFSEEGFKRNSRKDEFFSYMKSFLGIFFSFFF